MPESWNNSFVSEHLSGVEAGQIEEASDHWTPLHRAVNKLDIDEIRNLLNLNEYPINAITKETNATALHYAVNASCSGDEIASKVETIKLLVAHGADLNPHDRAGATPLHIAAKHDHLEAASTLIELGAQANVNKHEPREVVDVESHEKPNIYSDSEFSEEQCKEVLRDGLTKGAAERLFNLKDATPLHDAAGAGHPRLVKFLLEKGAVIDAPGLGVGTPLACGVTGKNLEVCKMLLSHDGGPKCLEVRDVHGYLPIHHAARTTPDILRLLIENGADVNSIATDGRETYRPKSTPLGKICSHQERDGLEELARILLDAGADPSSLDGMNTAPLSHALTAGNVKIAELLVERGAEVGKSSVSAVVLFLSFIPGSARTRVTEFLIRQGRDHLLKEIDETGYTPMHSASTMGSANTIDLLVSAGASIEDRVEDGRRPLHMACSTGYLECVQKLLSLNAEINPKDNKGWTPLHLASQNGHLDIVKELLNPSGGFKPVQVGGTLLASDHFAGNTAADLAMSNGHHAIVKILLEKGDVLSSGLESKSSKL